MLTWRDGELEHPEQCLLGASEGEHVQRVAVLVGGGNCCSQTLAAPRLDIPERQFGELVPLVLRGERKQFGQRHRLGI